MTNIQIIAEEETSPYVDRKTYGVMDIENLILVLQSSLIDWNEAPEGFDCAWAVDSYGQAHWYNHHELEYSNCYGDWNVESWTSFKREDLRCMSASLFGFSDPDNWRSSLRINYKKTFNVKIEVEKIHVPEK